MPLIRLRTVMLLNKFMLLSFNLLQILQYFLKLKTIHWFLLMKINKKI